MNEKLKENWPGYNKILLPLGHKADINNLTDLTSYIIERKKELLNLFMSCRKVVI